MLFPFSFAPTGWALCNGQLIAISQNQALFSLLGTTFGGNGTTNFALPDLRGRAAIMTGNGFNLGQNGGEEFHTLTIGEVPAHSHPPMATTTAAGATPPRLNDLLLGTSSPSEYASASPASTMATGVIGNAGASVPHENRSPYLVLNWCIALTGVYPSRN